MLKEIDNEPLFLKLCQEFMKSKKVPECLDPSRFDLSPANCERVKDLLLRLQQN